MEEQAWLLACWGGLENESRAKFYKLTDVARAPETKRWGRLALAIIRTLEAS